MCGIHNSKTPEVSFNHKAITHKIL